MRDPYFLKYSIKEELSQKHLDKFIYVQLVLDIFYGSKPREKVVYFLEIDKTFKLSDVYILNKDWKELEYVLYSVEEKNEVIRSWVKIIKKIITDKKKLLKVNSNELYRRKYVLEDDTKKETTTNSRCLNTSFRVTHFFLNVDRKRSYYIYLGESMSRNSVYNLRKLRKK